MSLGREKDFLMLLPVRQGCSVGCPIAINTELFFLITGDGRWRSVERRCAQISERGINWGCDWGYDLQGVYWEECYCAEDGCNAGGRPYAQRIFIAFSVLLPLLLLWTLQLVI